MAMRLFLSSLCVLVLFSHAGVAYDHLDSSANITIKWDVINWTPDGYVASVTINDYKKFSQIVKAGWTLGWSWGEKEVIWNMVGAKTTDQGDCSSFKGSSKPLCCKKNPVVVAALGRSQVQIAVGDSGNSSKIVTLPHNFSLLIPGAGYTCGPPRIIPSTVFITLRGKFKVWMTWDVTCKYSK